MFSTVLAIGSIAALSWVLIRHLRTTHRRLDYIRYFELPQGLFEKLQRKWPQLTHKDCQLTAQALRQFFLVYAKSRGQFVAMPSQVTDELWHEFILHTQRYQEFCKQAFGHFLHHTPATALSKDRSMNTGLRRCWTLACKEENLNPLRPLRVPLLFALDSKLAIADGIYYLPEDGTVKRTQAGDDGGAMIFSTTDFSSSSFDGCTQGFGDGGGGGADAGACADGGGASCGGGGCGGGGGGD